VTVTTTNNTAEPLSFLIMRALAKIIKFRQ